MIPYDDQIACLSREIDLRKDCYPKWVESKRMTQAMADREISRMEGALETVRRMQMIAIAGTP